MANTYTLIASNTLGSSAASVTFSAIPNTYTDLVLKMSIRSDRAALQCDLLMKINATTSGYSTTFVFGNGSSAGSTRQSSTAQAYVGTMNAATSTSNTFTNGEIYIPSYTASQNKPYSAFVTMEDNGTTVYYTGAWADLWQNTGAITSLELYPNNTTNFVSGSSFFLYGIAKS